MNFLDFYYFLKDYQTCSKSESKNLTFLANNLDIFLAEQFLDKIIKPYLALIKPDLNFGKSLTIEINNYFKFC